MANDPNPKPAIPVKDGAVTLHRQRVSFMGWRPDKPDIRDHRMLVQRNIGAEPPPKALLAAQFMPPIRDQGSQGSCTGHSTRSAVQYKLASEGKPRGELSPRFIYYAGRLVEGTTAEDAGCEIRDVIKAVAKIGVATEVLCPYSDKVLTQRPSTQAFKEAIGDVVTSYKRVEQHQVAIKQALAGGNPIVFGFTVYENFMDDQTAATGMMQQPKGNVDGGHAVWMCGYDDTQKIGDKIGGVLIGNSWGTDWGCVGPSGTRGYFWIDWSLVCNPNFCDDLWAINVVA
jgi:C1A family cysteine protease